MSSKRARRLQVMNGNVNLEKYVSVLEVFLIPSYEYEFGNSDVIFMDNKTLYIMSSIL